jgi:hypothetical protein
VKLCHEIAELFHVNCTPVLTGLFAPSYHVTYTILLTFHELLVIPYSLLLVNSNPFHWYLNKLGVFPHHSSSISIDHVIISHSYHSHGITDTISGLLISIFSTTIVHSFFFITVPETCLIYQVTTQLLVNCLVNSVALSISSYHVHDKEIPFNSTQSHGVNVNVIEVLLQSDCVIKHHIEFKSTSNVSDVQFQIFQKLSTGCTHNV